MGLQHAEPAGAGVALDFHQLRASSARPTRYRVPLKTNATPDEMFFKQIWFTKGAGCLADG